jgi:predicted PurR-regulated permease PerM
MALKEKYQEMYGEGQNFSENVNKNVYNHRNNMNDYTNADFDNMNGNMNRNMNGNMNSNMNRNMNGNMNRNMNGNMNDNMNDNVPQTSYVFNLFVVFILAAFIGAIVYFKDTLIKYYNDMQTKPSVNTELKQLNKSIKEEQKLREQKEKEAEKEKKIKKGGVNQLVQKMNYKSNQIAKDDGYCYIGYDKGMRNCGEIYESQICMSGEIFPSLEMCMFPKLRS